MSNVKYWVFRKHESLKEIWQFKTKAGCLSDKQAEAVLQRLASTDLTAEEVIESSLRKNCKNYRPLLEVQGKYGKSLTLSLGENPWYTARVEEF
ncbi:MAG: hypothetical protein R8G34_21645 [Paracoccaceae bacterium]|nr:hypothetical protein [Paracoccaceae bacterium]